MALSHENFRYSYYLRWYNIMYARMVLWGTITSHKNNIFYERNTSFLLLDITFRLARQYQANSNSFFISSSSSAYCRPQVDVGMCAISPGLQLVASISFQQPFVDLLHLAGRSYTTFAESYIKKICDFRDLKLQRNKNFKLKVFGW